MRTRWLVFAGIVSIVAIVMLSRGGRDRSAATGDPSRELRTTSDADPSEQVLGVEESDRTADRREPAAGTGQDTADVLVVEVLDETGSPLTGVDVVLFFEKADGTPCGRGDGASTDGAGEARLDLADVAGVVGERRIAVAWPYAKAHGLIPSAIVPPGAGRVVLRGVPSGTFSGALRWSDGGAVEGGFVEARIAWSDGRQHREVSAIVSEGRFEAHGIAGRVTSLKLNCEEDEVAPATIVLDFDLPPGERVERDLVLPRPASLRAEFRNADTGEPIEGVVWRQESVWGAFVTSGSVWLSNVSDAAGVIERPHALERGTRAPLVFVHPDYAPIAEILDVPEGSGDLDLDFRLERTATIEGVVEDARGRPLAGVLVGYEPVAADPIEWKLLEPYGTLTNADGRFRIEGLVRCDQVVLRFVRLPVPGSPVVMWSETASLAAAQARGHWTMPDPVAIRGVVLDERGAPMRGASVEAQREGGFSLRDGWTDDEGGFSLEPAHPGRWTLTVDHADEEPCGSGCTVGERPSRSTSTRAASREWRCNSGRGPLRGNSPSRT